MRTISIGAQGFEFLRKNNCFYIDKTDFIREWWENKDIVTLITRPRRFGKTLNMDTLNCFFDYRYAGRSDLFEGLSIWQNEDFRKIQGTYPVLFLSFSTVKDTNCGEAVKRICDLLCRLYRQYDYLADSMHIDNASKAQFAEMCREINAFQAAGALNFLSELLCCHFNKKCILLLDEYDTPLQEAYVNGYWEEMAAFIRSFFNSAFKSNPSMERALLTGITRVSKESIFSDLNNLKVITATAPKYATAFGFTQEEVLNALEEYGLSDQSENVRYWYDGFTFGNVTDIYNPWSITNYLDERKFAAYWANSSSNSLTGALIRRGSSTVKRYMEILLAGDCIKTVIDEEIIFNQLDTQQNAIWSLLLASGYLKLDHTETEADYYEITYYLRLTNFEVRIMFEKLFAGWFQRPDVPYNEFLSAMQAGNLAEMNLYMNQILVEMISSFDVAGKPSDKLHPERFYHGLVLGLMASERKYEVRSNGESGYGRYDITMVPKRTIRQRGEILPSFVIEFKLFNPDAPDFEKKLEDTVERALTKIEEKAYDTALLTQGISKTQIRHYGFAFEGKKVLIGSR